MTEPNNIQELEQKLIEANARHGIREAGAEAHEAVLLPHVTSRLRVTDGGRVTADGGKSPAQVVEELKEDPSFGVVFGNGTGESEAADKPYSEMTLDEKAAYLIEKYGGEAA